jgi:hypothetical protein
VLGSRAFVPHRTGEERHQAGVAISGTLRREPPAAQRFSLSALQLVIAFQRLRTLLISLGGVAMPPRNSPRPGKKARTVRRIATTTSREAAQPHVTSQPTKKQKVRACVLATFDKKPPKTWPETAPKDKWPDPVRWDAKANDIAKCVKRKFPGADQAELKEMLLDNHTTKKRELLIDRLTAKVR